MSGLIKICGLRDRESVTVAIDAGATAVGFILAPSRRRVSPEQAAEMLENQERADFDAVGVVVNESAEELQMIRERSGLDIIQLAGDEAPSLLDSLAGRFWKVLRFPVGTDLDSARSAVSPWLNHRNAVELVLIDAAVDGAYGGTGHRADWELAARLADEFPIVLAGGLNPESVAEAITIVRPFGVDVASGVEVDGQKSPELIRQFIDRSRAAFALQST